MPTNDVFRPSFFRLASTAAAIVLFCITATPALAVDKGDQVEYEFRDQLIPGKVMEVLDNGRLMKVDIGTPESSVIRLIRADMIRVHNGKPVAPPKKEGGADVPAVALELPPVTAFPPGKSLSLKAMPPPTETPADSLDPRYASFKPSLVKTQRVSSRHHMGYPILVDPAVPTIAYSVRAGLTAPVFETTIHVLSGPSAEQRRRYSISEHNVRLGGAETQSGHVLGIVSAGRGDRAESFCLIAGLASESPSIAAHWKATPPNDRADANVYFHRMAKENIAVVCNDNVVHAYDVAAGRELWQSPVPGFSRPAVSPGGKLTALRFQDQYAILETETGRQLGSIPAKNAKPGAAIGFSPDGTMLAIASDNHLWVHALAGGRLLREHVANVDLVRHGGPIVWPYKNYLITPAGMLFDLSKNVLSWNYRIDPDVVKAIDNPTTGLFPFGGDEGINFVRLPHREAGLASNRDLTNLVAIETGSEIQVVIDVQDDVKVNREKVVANLEAAIVGAGHRVAESSDTKLIAQFVRGKERTHQFQRFGQGGLIPVKVAPFGASLALERSGEELWKLSLAADLGNTILGSVEAAAEAVKHPPADFWRGAPVPNQVLKKEFQGGFGSSHVTQEGIR